jgi:mono/diheme cytochrome c family protein
MKRILYAVGLMILTASCSTEPKTKEVVQDGEYPQTQVAVDNGMGVGPFKDVKLASAIDAAIVDKGKGIYEMKCQACHRLDDQRLVGPGWKDLTKRRKPEWILNMIVNVDEMLQKDTEAQKLLETYLTKMPNQNVSEDEAMALLEFMRKNDEAN